MATHSVKLLFVPGMLDLASSWSAVIPSGVEFVPIEWHPSGADELGSPGRQFGGPGDIIEVGALRLLSMALRLSDAGHAWAIGCHSAGGQVVYRCLDFLSDLVRDPCDIQSIAHASRSWLPESEGRDLAETLFARKCKQVDLPVAVISFEGTLIACEVESWGQDWAARDIAPDEDWVHEELSNPCSQWTWPMARACSGALWQRCENEVPARHLASIHQWLQLPHSPGLCYVAGERSSCFSESVFPALRQLADSCGKSDKMILEVVENAGHNMNRHAPDMVKAIMTEMLFGSDACKPRRKRLRV